MYVWGFEYLLAKSTEVVWMLCEVSGESWCHPSSKHHHPRVLKVFVSSQEATTAQGLKGYYKLEYFFFLFQWATTIIPQTIPFCSSFQW